MEAEAEADVETIRSRNDDLHDDLLNYSEVFLVSLFHFVCRGFVVFFRLLLAYPDVDLLFLIAFRQPRLVDFSCVDFCTTTKRRALLVLSLLLFFLDPGNKLSTQAGLVLLNEAKKRVQLCLSVSSRRRRGTPSTHQETMSLRKKPGRRAGHAPA